MVILFTLNICAICVNWHHKMTFLVNEGDSIHDQCEKYMVVGLGFQKHQTWLNTCKWEVGEFVLWAQSTTKDYITAVNKLQSCLLVILHTSRETIKFFPIYKTIKATGWFSKAMPHWLFRAHYNDWKEFNETLLTHLKKLFHSPLKDQHLYSQIPPDCIDLKLALQFLCEQQADGPLSSVVFPLDNSHACCLDDNIDKIKYEKYKIKFIYCMHVHNRQWTI